jgi:carboxypeptidase Taq
MNSIEKLKSLSKEILVLQHAANVLQWDMETYMPESAVVERSEQLMLLYGIIHEKMVSDEMQKVLSNLDEGGNFSKTDVHMIRETSRRVKKSLKLPTEHVKKITQKASITQAEWAKARNNADFAIFSPHFKELLDLVRQTAEYIGYNEHPYDALLDDYEPGMKSSMVQTILDNLAADLTPFVARIADAKKPRDDFLQYRPLSASLY